MNKRLLIFVILGTTALFFSFSVRNFALKRSARRIDKIDSENLERLKESLLDSVANYRTKGDYLKAKKSLKKFIEEFPDSKESDRIQKDIEGLNIKILFSDVITDDSLSYKIKPGDTLAKIASQFNTTVGLLKRSNNLKDDLILPGKFLKVNRAEFSILVDKSENMLILRKSDNEVIKTYRVSTGKNLSTPLGTFKIEEKLISPLWYKVGAIVEPSDPGYELGSRWLGISMPGYGIHGTADNSSIGQHITKGCVRMRDEDVEELYDIVTTGTEVLIIN